MLMIDAFGKPNLTRYHRQWDAINNDISNLLNNQICLLVKDLWIDIVFKFNNSNIT